MDSIVKTFLGIYMLLMIVFVSMGIIDANLDTRNAQEFASLCETTIKEANYDENVVDKLKLDAVENGYTLYFETYSGNNSRAKYGYLTLQYRFSLPIFNIIQYHKINKFV